MRTLTGEEEIEMKSAVKLIVAGYVQLEDANFEDDGICVSSTFPEFFKRLCDDCKEGDNAEMLADVKSNEPLFLVEWQLARKIKIPVNTPENEEQAFEQAFIDEFIKRSQEPDDDVESLKAKLLENKKATEILKAEVLEHEKNLALSIQKMTKGWTAKDMRRFIHSDEGMKIAVTCVEYFLKHAGT